jgi:hypothetical protein
LGLAVDDEGLRVAACRLYLLQLTCKLLVLSLELMTELLVVRFFSESPGRALAVYGILVILLLLNPFEISNMDRKIFVTVKGLWQPFSNLSWLVREDWLLCCVLCFTEAR